MISLKVTSVFLAMAFAATPLLAERTLDLNKAEKQEVHQSMIGFRNTLLIYKFADQKAVVTVLIDNKDATFPITATVHLFAEATSAEDLDKWINNQHSDGLFPEVPEPVLIQALPKEACTITSQKKKDLGGGPALANPTDDKTFHEYEVSFAVKEQRIDKQFVLPAFAGTTKVFVEAKR